jgi:pimeloyl-ACP methyl ester carboxylesterase
MKPMTLIASLSVAALAAGELRAGGKLDDAPSRYAKIGDAKVHYKTLGEGKKAVVLVHGWSSDLTFWDKQLPPLAGKVRVVLIDLPGHGKSDRPKIEYTMDHFAKAVDAVLTDAGVEEAVVVGHSMGTPIARQYYRLYPKKTRGLIAVDGALSNAVEDIKMLEGFLKQFEGPNFKETAAKFIDAMFMSETPPAVREHVKKVVESASQHVAVSAMKNMFDPAIWKDDKIDVPVLALMAPSKFWTEKYQKAVKALSPGMDYRTFEGTGHFLHMERPAPINDAILAFLKKVGYVNDK